jgi:hypothetical protein
VSGGASTYRESIPVEPSLRDACARLLSSVSWSGAAMIEFKLEETTGRPYLMEVNGRLWGSLKLAIDSGVDFPVLLARMTSGATLTPTTSYRTGIRCRWFWGDLNHLMHRLRFSNAALDLREDAPSKFRALVEFLIWRPWRDRFEVFAWTDPYPWIHEGREWFGDRWRAVMHRAGSTTPSAASAARLKPR